MERPVNYERAQWEWNTDMYVPQYPGADWLEDIDKNGSDRLPFRSEYAHAMGNSTGNLWGQWQAIYKISEPSEDTSGTGQTRACSKKTRTEENTGLTEATSE